MGWTPRTSEQQTALMRVNTWMKDRTSQVFYLGGYAGTGKTELARHFAEGVQGEVCFGAFTGKAVLVLIQRGCYNARTIHSWLYRPSGRSREKLKQLETALAGLEGREGVLEADVKLLKLQVMEEQERADAPAWAVSEETELAQAALVILDECSMIDRHMAQDLMGACKKILVLGDPAQLPPVKGTGYFTSQTPDYLLTEVVRHDNGILDIATRVRQGELELPFGNLNADVVKLHKQELCHQDYTRADQILTGRNVARMRLNQCLRAAHGHEGLYPVATDKVICLRNNRAHGLVNGQIGAVVNDAAVVDPACLAFALQGHSIPDPEGVSDADGGPSVLSVYTGHFEKYQDPDLRLLAYWQRREFDEFDYAYAITVHKGQGSQWPHPWVCDDGFNSWSKLGRQRWLYTAITRAESKLTIVA